MKEKNIMKENCKTTFFLYQNFPMIPMMYFPNKFAAHYIEENNIIPKNLLLFSKLDGVGPLDNRPSIDKLHHFVQKKGKNLTCHTSHVTCNM